MVEVGLLFTAGDSGSCSLAWWPCPSASQALSINHLSPVNWDTSEIWVTVGGRSGNYMCCAS